MNPLKKRLLSCLMLLLGTASPAIAHPVDEDSFLLEIGKWIGGAIRGETPEPQREVLAVEIMDNGQPVAAPGEKDKEDFNKRIEAYSVSMKTWVHQVCKLSGDKKARVDELFAAAAKDTMTAFADKGKIKPRNEYIPVTLPVVFSIGEESTAAAFSQEVLSSLRKNVLSPAETELLEIALKERTTFQTRAYVSFLVSLIDMELFLTGEQRARVTQRMLELKPAVLSPLYSFQPQAYYLPYESLNVMISRVSLSDLLETSQKKRLQDLTDSDQNSQIVFQASSGVEGWRDQMNELSTRQREQFLRAAAVRVTWYQRELHLSADQVEYLSNAGKGATIRALGDWKENTQQTLDQMEQQMAQMGGNFGFGAESIDAKSIDQNEIWADAVKNVTAGLNANNLQARKTADRMAMAESVLALLDTELWLLPEQRTLLLPLVEKTLPKDASTTRYQEYIRDVILLAHPLFKIPEDTRNPILSEQQRAAWKHLESLFKVQKENNYVEIQLRNNGGSFGFNLGQ